MKNQRTFTHFIFNGKDLGTFGSFNNSSDFEKLKESFGHINKFDSIILKGENELALARKLTGLKL